MNTLQKTSNLIIILVLTLCLSFAFSDVALAEIDDYSVAKYAGSGGFSLYVNAGGKLYSVGDNAYGCLGVGSDVSHIDPQFVADNVTIVAAGEESFAFAVCNRQLFAWGKNVSGQLGLGNVCESVSKLTQVNVGFTPTAVACGKRHTLLLSDDGTVYAAGNNEYGQLGVPSQYAKDSVQRSFCKVAATDKKIVQIAAAEYTSYVLTDNGEVYAFGDNYYGELGAGDEVDKSPKNSVAYKCDIDEKVTEISASGSNAMALTQSGKVYVWGDNKSGQIAAGQENRYAVPQQIVDFKQDDASVDIVAKKILCCGTTNYIISSEGKLFAFGVNRNNNCGFDTGGNPVTIATKVQFYAPINLQEKKAAGASEAELDALPVDTTKKAEPILKDFAGGCSARVFVVDSSDKTWSMGDNGFAQLCSGNMATSTVPVQSTLFRVKQYDGVFVEKDYMTWPIIFLCLVAATMIAYIIVAEIKRKKTKQKQKD